MELIKTMIYLDGLDKKQSEEDSLAWKDFLEKVRPKENLDEHNKNIIMSQVQDSLLFSAPELFVENFFFKIIHHLIMNCRGEELLEVHNFLSNRKKEYSENFFYRASFNVFLMHFDMTLSYWVCNSRISKEDLLELYSFDFTGNYERVQDLDLSYRFDFVEISKVLGKEELFICKSHENLENALKIEWVWRIDSLARSLWVLHIDGFLNENKKLRSKLLKKFMHGVIYYDYSEISQKETTSKLAVVNLILDRIKGAKKLLSKKDFERIKLLKKE